MVAWRREKGIPLTTAKTSARNRDKYLLIFDGICGIWWWEEGWRGWRSADNTKSRIRIEISTKSDGKVEWMAGGECLVCCQH